MRPLENTGIPGKGSQLEDLDAGARNTFPSKNYGTAGFVDHARIFFLAGESVARDVSQEITCRWFEFR